MPTVMIVLLVRNKAHLLPNTLAFISQLDYPKDRISLYIRSDRNQDKSAEILSIWLETHEKEYHSINAKLKEEFYHDEYPFSWSKARFRRLMELKEAALNEARQSWTDLVWFLDADVFITYNQTLKDFALADFIVASPMLKSIGNYANFWAGMNEQFYYQRTDDYFPILERKDLGCFDVPMVHSSVFINMKKSKSKQLTFLPENVPDYAGPVDDIITFAISARTWGIQLYVCNWEEYGYIMQPLEEASKLEHDLANLVNLKLQMIPDIGPLPVEKELQHFLSPLAEKDTLGFDQVYLINLKRRPDRKKKMDDCFDLLGVNYKYMDAVDGKTMDQVRLSQTFDNKHLNDLSPCLPLQSFLEENEIQMLPGYKDRYHKRPMTFGEIGCFMSHYNIWRDVIENDYEQVVVFEDDIRFEPFFRLEFPF
jgi:collagen beta-1,O-galactosyltransferase